MKEKKECKIVQDLLPNYIEKFTSEETNKYIEDHLKECDECRDAFEKMKPEMENNKASDVEINYMKKYQRKLISTVFKTIGSIIFSLLFAYIVLVISRWNTLSDINNKYCASISKTNYHVIGKQSGITTEYIRKDNTYIQKYGENIIWSDISKNETYIINTNHKTYYIENKFIGFNALTVNEIQLFGSKKEDPENYLFKQRIKYAMNLLYDLKSIYIPMTFGDCYILDNINEPNQGDKIYIDKETGLFLGNTGGLKDTTQTFKYEFDVVKDADIEKPDLTEYTFKEKGK